MGSVLPDKHGVVGVLEKGTRKNENLESSTQKQRWWSSKDGARADETEA